MAEEHRVKEEKFFKPKILVSACFEKAVRYNGGLIFDAIVERLKPWIEPVYFCPEVATGLGVPRPVLIIKKEDKKEKLIQPSTGKDYTKEMYQTLKKELEAFSEIDGALLKSKSPSCGVRSAKVYQNEKVIGKTDGFLVKFLIERSPTLPIEDESRLKDRTIYYCFLTAIFSRAEWRLASANFEMRDLIEFHTRYKYLLKTFNEEKTKQLGKILADPVLSLREKKELYERIFGEILTCKPSRKKHVNTLYHLLGFFKKKISQREKKHVIKLIEEFRRGRLDLKVPLELIRSLSLRFEEKYVLDQKYLDPFPEELL